MTTDPRVFVRFVESELRRRADPEKAAGMQAYMKTDMPFYGVQKPQREQVLRAMADEFPVPDGRAYRGMVSALWCRPHREEKYLAIAWAAHHRAHITPAVLPLYRRLIVEGAWWDFVDDIAIRLVGRLLLEQRARVAPVLEKWIDDPNLWVRRSAIIAHIKHKQDTDERMLFDHCLRRAHETDFFIRKAIGWALREHAKTNPQGVDRFLRANRKRLSTLSFREASKHLTIA